MGQMIHSMCDSLHVCMYVCMYVCKNLHMYVHAPAIQHAVAGQQHMLAGEQHVGQQQSFFHNSQTLENKFKNTYVLCMYVHMYVLCCRIICKAQRMQPPKTKLPVLYVCN